MNGKGKGRILNKGKGNVAEGKGKGHHRFSVACDRLCLSCAL